jgi:hypothetical protein
MPDAFGVGLSGPFEVLSKSPGVKRAVFQAAGLKRVHRLVAEAVGETLDGAQVAVPSLAMFCGMDTGSTLPQSRAAFSDLCTSLQLEDADLAGKASSEAMLADTLAGFGEEEFFNHVAKELPNVAAMLASRCVLTKALGMAVQEDETIKHEWSFHYLHEKGEARGVAVTPEFPHQFAMIMAMERHLAGAADGISLVKTDEIKTWVEERRRAAAWATDTAGFGTMATAFMALLAEDAPAGGRCAPST